MKEVVGKGDWWIRGGAKLSGLDCNHCEWENFERYHQRSQGTTRVEKSIRWVAYCHWCHCFSHFSQHRLHVLLPPLCCQRMMSHLCRLPLLLLVFLVDGLAPSLRICKLLNQTAAKWSIKLISRVLWLAHLWTPSRRLCTLLLSIGNNNVSPNVASSARFQAVPKWLPATWPEICQHPLRGIRL